VCVPLFGDTVSRPRLVMVVDHEDMPFGTRRNFWDVLALVSFLSTKRFVEASELFPAWTDAEGCAEFQL